MSLACSMSIVKKGEIGELNESRGGKPFILSTAIINDFPFDIIIDPTTPRSRLEEE